MPSQYPPVVTCNLKVLSPVFRRRLLQAAEEAPPPGDPPPGDPLPGDPPPDDLPPDDPPVAPHSCGALDAACRHCAALHFEGERTQRGGFSECCAQGKVALEPLGPTPALLEALLTEDYPDSRNFRKAIRQYNSALAMASFVAEVKAPPGKYPLPGV